MNNSNLHNIKQTKENKVIVDDYLLSLLQNTNINILKSTLQDLLHKSEREVRQEIQKISLFYPVLSLSSKAGYTVVNTKKLIKEDDQLGIASTIILIKRQLKETNNRIKMLKKKEKPLIAALKVLEKCTK